MDAASDFTSLTIKKDAEKSGSRIGVTGVVARKSTESTKKEEQFTVLILMDDTTQYFRVAFWRRYDSGSTQCLRTVREGDVVYLKDVLTAQAELGLWFNNCFTTRFLDVQLIPSDRLSALRQLSVDLNAAQSPQVDDMSDDDLDSDDHDNQDHEEDTSVLESDSGSSEKENENLSEENVDDAYELPELGTGADNDDDDDGPRGTGKPAVERHVFADVDSESENESDLEFIDEADPDSETADKIQRKMDRITSQLRRDNVRDIVGKDDLPSESSNPSVIEYSEEEEEDSITDPAERLRIEQLCDAMSFEDGHSVFFVTKQGVEFVVAGRFAFADCVDYYLPAEIKIKEDRVDHYECELLESGEYISRGKRQLLRPSQFLLPNAEVFITRIPGEAQFQNPDNFVEGLFLEKVGRCRFRVLVGKERYCVKFRDLAIRKDCPLELAYYNRRQQAFVGGESDLGDHNVDTDIDSDILSGQTGISDDLVIFDEDSAGRESSPQKPWSNTDTPSPKRKSLRYSSSPEIPQSPTKRKCASQEKPQFQKGDNVFARREECHQYQYGTVGEVVTENADYKYHIRFSKSFEQVTAEGAVVALDRVLQIENRISVVGHVGDAIIKDVDLAERNYNVEVVFLNSDELADTIRVNLEQIFLSDDQMQDIPTASA